MDCVVENCHNEASGDERQMCTMHLRRFIAGDVYEDARYGGALLDHCVNGHAFTVANTRWESSGNRGKSRRRCRECLRNKAAKAAKAKAAMPAELPNPYRPSDKTLTTAIHDFEKARELVAGNCYENSTEYIDWVFEEYDGEKLPVPTAERAAELCHGCPLLPACRNYAIAAREQNGVWGGVAIVDGEVVK
jgi:hypothetical protein